MDFIKGLLKVKGYSTLLVLVDRLSKYAHFLFLKHPFLAQTMAAVFAKEIVQLQGVPTSISNQDRIFLSNFWKELFRLQGIVPKRSTAYHPQTGRQSGVVNRCLKAYLRCFTSEKPR